MKSLALMDLFSALDALKAAADQVVCTLKADPELRWDLPTHQEDETRESAVEAMARTFTWINREPGPHKRSSGLLRAGVISCSEEVLDAVHTLNDAKATFKQTVNLLRDRQPGGKNRRLRLDSLARQAYINSHKDDDISISEATDEFHQITRQTGISQLDLQRCYTPFRILEPGTLSVSYSWDHGAAKVIPYTREQVEDAIASLKGVTQDAAWRAFRQVPADTRFAYRQNLPPALIANLVIQKGKDRVRRKIKVSGPALIAAPHLPLVIWREKPDIPPIRKPRDGKTLSSAPLIKALSIYTYL